MRTRQVERRASESRIPELRALSAPLLELAAARRSAPLLYIELIGIDRIAARRRRAVLAACKREVATALRAATGSVLRRSDVVAAGPGARWFVALLVGRAVDARARAAVDDADLGLIAARLQAVVRAGLRSAAGTRGVSSEISAIAGWTVLDPVSRDRPLDELRQAVRGAAVVARVEAQRAVVLAAVTHELRTPLTSIIGYAERLRDEPGIGAQTRTRYSRIVAEEARRLHRLVESLIDAGAWSAGRLSLRLRRCGLRALARAGWTALAGTTNGRLVRLEMRGETMALVDAERMQQVFINLFDNAVRHSPEGGVVRVRIEGTSKRVTIRISDEGRGFSKRAALGLGTPFAPAADGRVGLGLSIARLLVEAHGGSLAVAAKRGPGACVEIRLPLDAAHAAEKAVTTS